MISKIKNLINFIFFPLIALFIPENDFFIFKSLRTIRFEKVSKYIKGKVLDVGCGPQNLFIKKYVTSSNSLGIDFYPYDGVEIVIKNPAKLPFEDASFDTITLIAVGGHIPKRYRIREFREFYRILQKGGRLIMTEGEPLTQFISHKWREMISDIFNLKSMDTIRSWDSEETTCLPYEEILSLMNLDGLRLKKKVKFMWGLNNIYISKKEL